MTDTRIKTAREIVLHVFSRDGVLDEDERIGLAALDDAGNASRANCAALAAANALVRQTTTLRYLDRLLSERQAAIDELADSAA